MQHNSSELERIARNASFFAAGASFSARVIASYLDARNPEYGQTLYHLLEFFEDVVTSGLYMLLVSAPTYIVARSIRAVAAGLSKKPLTQDSHRHQRMPLDYNILLPDQTETHLN